MLRFDFDTQFESGISASSRFINHQTDSFKLPGLTKSASEQFAIRSRIAFTKLNTLAFKLFITGSDTSSTSALAPVLKGDQVQVSLGREG